jgi:RNA polymerase sigma-70 factor (ECF subfamily)
MDDGLAASFLRRAGRKDVDVAALEPRLREALDEARVGWPDVTVEPQAFAAHLGARVGDGAILDGLAALHAGDLYLACACESGDGAALAAFERAFLARLPDVLSRFSRDPALVDEVRQGLRAKLLTADGGRARIADYQGRGSLAGWVRAAAARMALDLIEQQKRFVPTEDPQRGLPLATPEPELDFLKARYAGEFQRAFEAAFGALEPPARTLLRLYYLDGLGLAQIGKLEQVHESTISRRLDAAREALFAETRRQLAEILDVDTAEVESLMRLAASRIDVSLRTLLASGAG